MSDDAHPSPPSWIPRTGMRTRWDRTLTVRDAIFRWHSRLDGTAVLHGPARVLSVGERVEMPVGHLHRLDAAPPAIFYVVTAVHDDGAEHAWVRVARVDEPAVR